MPCASFTMPPTTMIRMASNFAAVKMFCTRVAKFTEYELMNVISTVVGGTERIERRRGSRAGTRGGKEYEGR